MSERPRGIRSFPLLLFGYFAIVIIVKILNWRELDEVKKGLYHRCYGYGFFHHSFFGNKCKRSQCKNEDLKPVYSLVINGYDWGPSVDKVIFNTGSVIQGESVNKNSFKIFVERSYPSFNLETGAGYEGIDSGSRKITNAYLSDSKGNKLTTNSGQFIAFEMEVHPDLAIASPFHFDLRSFTNQYTKLQYTIVQQKALKDTAGKAINQLSTNHETPYSVIEPTVDPFDTTGKYNYKDADFGNIALTYASYMPKEKKQKHPLIIWLHGAGEGGTDPRIALLGNKAAELAEDSIQAYFGAAAVLVPQTPTFWMNDGKGQYTQDGSSMYTKALTALIKQYVAQNKASIDVSRIYIGGGSNGGFMTLNMLLANPGYFAAAYPAAEAYADAWLTQQDIDKLKDMPIWFTASGDDKAVDASRTSTPTYKRLMAAGAENVHYTLFDTVTDRSGQYIQGKGNNSPYKYDGHWSWIHVLNNDVSEDFNGLPVKVNGKSVTLMEWLASQKK